MDVSSGRIKFDKFITPRESVGPLLGGGGVIVYIEINKHILKSQEHETKGV